MQVSIKALDGYTSEICQQQKVCSVKTVDFCSSNMQQLQQLLWRITDGAKIKYEIQIYISIFLGCYTSK